MIVELIAPKGTGKSTVAPLVAGGLGLSQLRGQAFHRLDGSEKGEPELWADRVLSVSRNPRLFFAAFAAQGGSLKERLRFSLNTCRRDRLAAQAAAAGGGVFESGPLNSLIQATASYRRDVLGLHPHIVMSDVYVRLRAPEATIRERLEGRGGTTIARIEDNREWVQRYEDAADRVLPLVGRPVVEVAAVGVPEEVAAMIVEAMSKLGHTNGGGPE